MGRIRLLLGVWLILVLIASKWPVAHLGFFLLTDYGPYFIAGAMFYLVHEEGVSFYKLFIIGISYLLAVRGAIGNAAGMATRFHTRISPVVVAGILAVSFLLLLIVATGRTRNLASAKWLALGTLTYPLYLIHQNVGFMLFNLSYPRLNPHIVMAGTLAGVLLTAYLVNRWIERPFSKPFRVRLERGLELLSRQHPSAPRRVAVAKAGEERRARL